MLHKAINLTETQTSALTSFLCCEKRLEYTVQDLGHQVLVARTSAEALAILHAGPIDLLFTDVALSDGLSGVELAEQAVVSFPTLRVLLTTGHPGRAELLSQNDFAVLAKPYTRDGLASALQRLGCGIRQRIGA